MKTPMPISKKSISTVARQILRKVRRIRRISVGLAVKTGIPELVEDSKKAEARAIKVCRRQRRKFVALVQRR